MIIESKEELVNGIDFIYKVDLFNPKDEKTLPIEILTEDFKNVIFSFGEVSLGSIEDNVLKFDYFVIDANKHENLEQNQDFHVKLGDILLSIIKTSLDVQEELDSETRTNNTERNNQE